MARQRRRFEDNMVYHVLNRAVRRAVLFETAADYAAFEEVLLQSLQRFHIRLLAYCVMPNHWHLVLWPADVRQLPRFMHWLTMTHAQRWHARRGTAGTGPVYQGRYKAIAADSEARLLRVCRYVERNPLRAGLVARAEEWRWSSLWRRCNYCHVDVLDEGPVPKPADWIEHVNRAMAVKPQHQSTG